MTFHLNSGAFCLIINTLLTLLNDSLVLINPMLISVLVKVGDPSSRAAKTIARIIKMT